MMMGKWESPGCAPIKQVYNNGCHIIILISFYLRIVTLCSLAINGNNCSELIPVVCGVLSHVWADDPYLWWPCNFVSGLCFAQGGPIMFTACYCIGYRHELLITPYMAVF
uniref:Uncharacterized protein n=1 Tax=Pyxicephalus adspersus TaxID=30357 RepID=A0AAV3AFK8_PYXAD|nr:TPA: hypothetical protein GDO54_012898 [Pyxicephalus adspersus]